MALYTQRIVCVHIYLFFIFLCIYIYIYTNVHTLKQRITATLDPEHSLHFISDYRFLNIIKSLACSGGFSLAVCGSEHFFFLRKKKVKDRNSHTHTKEMRSNERSEKSDNCCKTRATDIKRKNKNEKRKANKTNKQTKEGGKRESEERNCPANRDRYTYFLPEIKYIQGHMQFGYIEIFFFKCSYSFS